MNILDLWVIDRFDLNCSAIDMLPAGLNFEISELSELRSADPDLVSSRSGLSQQLEEYSLADNRIVPDSQPSVQQITPAIKIQTKSSNPKRKRRSNDLRSSSKPDSPVPPPATLIRPRLSRLQRTHEK